MCSRDWLPFNYTFVISLFFVFGAKIAQSLFFFVNFFFIMVFVFCLATVWFSN
jgi:hypothetical protein